MFICTDCRNELNGRSVKQYLDDTLKSQCGPSAVPVPSTELTNQVQLLADAVDKLGKKVDGIASTQSYVGSNKSYPLLTPTGRAWLKPALKRPREEQYDSTSLATDRGTRSIDLSDLSIDSIVSAPTPPRFWLYLSGFQPQISPDDVQKIVTRCLDLSSPCDVIRLVPKGKDVSTMSFVSFKIGLDPALQERALLASTWLSGLVFREFVDQSKNSRRSTSKPVDNYRTPM